MDERHSRIQEYPWLSPALLAVAVGLELLTPSIVNGAALVAVAGMVAAITATFRYTLLIVTFGVAIIFVAALLSDFSDFAKGAQIVEVMIAGALALALRRMLDRQSVRFSLVRSTVETLQRAVLPPLPKVVGPLVVACRYEAASAEARIGGDLYAVQETPFGLRLLIADVRGRGLGAVSAVSIIVGAFRERAESEADLVGLAERLDRAVTRSAEQCAAPFAAEAFATALLGEIDQRGTTLRLLSCGHPAPYLVRNGELRPLDTGDAAPPLGMRNLAPGAGAPRSCNFPVGTTLLCVTDGVTEARNAAGAFYDPSREFRPALDVDPDRLIDALFTSISGWAEGERDDDMAVVAVAHVGDHGPA
ncbi:PP2C family protein-serine/threonine phosphatase [Streptomyces acidicola]|uniref:PP2C family protein-serine/threonine phosphatase n=1 Tax=Streptomyces acidicola TaxID=2596892 RepID=UPI0037FEBE0B